MGGIGRGVADKSPCRSWHTACESTQLLFVHRGDFGRLGHGDCGDVFLPKPVAALNDRRIVACSCGDTHTLCVTVSSDVTTASNPKP